MHFDSSTQKAPAAALSGAPWYKELNSYHWFVLIVAALGWLFDTMDQQLFNLARRPAIIDLLDVSPGDPNAAGRIAEYAGYATMIFMIGWATGGVFFGILGDRIGRAKTMMMTILFYSMFTGLSVFSTGVWDFSVYRFLTGLGVGGEFAVGVALVAEVMPDRARPYALGMAAGLVGGRQHDGGADRHRPRPVGAIGRDRQRVAHDVRRRRAAGAPGASSCLKN